MLCVCVLCVLCVCVCCVCVYIRTIPKSINTDNQDSDMRKMFGSACVKEGVE